MPERIGRLEAEGVFVFATNMTKLATTMSKNLTAVLDSVLKTDGVRGAVAGFGKQVER